MEVGSNANRRWIVFASSPVVSVRRLAARPVGAQRSTSIFGLEDLEDAGDNRGFADPRATRDHRDFAVQGRGDSLTL